jgi:16S rRNA processing protein RimM
MNNKDYIEIGKIVNTFGIKGELKVVSDSDFITYRFRKGAQIFLQTKNEMTSYNVSSLRIIKGNPVITINDLYDINAVNMYIGYTIYALKKDTPVLEKDEYMVDDLVGLDVYNQKNEKIGIVNDFILGGYQTIMEVKLISNKMVLIPFVDELILEVKLNQFVKIKLLEEMK